MVEILCALGGLFAGATIVYFLLGSRLSNLRADLDQSNAQNGKIQPLEDQNKQLFGKTQADAATIT